MKKIKIQIILFLLIFSFCFSIGQDINSGKIEKDKIEETEIIKIGEGNVEFSFCDGTYTFNKTTEIGKNNEICIMFTNSKNTDILIKSEFVGMGGNDRGTKSCLPANEPPSVDKIAPLFKDRDGKILIPANSTKKINTTFSFPIGYEGIQDICFAYSIGEANIKKEGNMFELRYRDVFPFSFLIIGKFEGKNIISNLPIKTNLENNNLIVDFGIKNESVLDNRIDVNLKVSNRFGFIKEFFWTGLALNTVTKSINITTKDLEKIELPRYKGPFKIEVTAKYKPYFEFDISNSGIDPKILEEQTITQNKSIFIFPTLPVIGLLVLIILLYFAFFKKTKVVYIQQTPSTNNTQ